MGRLHLFFFMCLQGTAESGLPSGSADLGAALCLLAPCSAALILLPTMGETRGQGLLQSPTPPHSTRLAPNALLQSCEPQIGCPWGLSPGADTLKAAPSN